MRSKTRTSAAAVAATSAPPTRTHPGTAATHGVGQLRAPPAQTAERIRQRVGRRWPSRVGTAVAAGTPEELGPAAAAGPRRRPRRRPPPWWRGSRPPRGDDGEPGRGADLTGDEGGRLVAVRSGDPGHRDLRSRERCSDGRGHGVGPADDDEPAGVASRDEGLDRRRDRVARHQHEGGAQMPGEGRGDGGLGGHARRGAAGDDDGGGRLRVDRPRGGEGSAPCGGGGRASATRLDGRASQRAGNPSLLISAGPLTRTLRPSRRGRHRAAHAAAGGAVGQVEGGDVREAEGRSDLGPRAGAGPAGQRVAAAGAPRVRDRPQARDGGGPDVLAVLGGAAVGGEVDGVDRLPLVGDDAAGA